MRMVKVATSGCFGDLVLRSTVIRNRVNMTQAMGVMDAT